MLFSPLFVPEALEQVVSDRAWLQAMLEVEAALAQAEARLGVIPREAAEVIAARSAEVRFDARLIFMEARATGNPAEALVRNLRPLVGEPVANFVHHGATSQDILDTAAMLVTRRALAVILQELVPLADALAGLAVHYRDALMPGRTLLQQALPITFGLKAAGWLEGLLRAMERLQRLESETLAVQLGGATGTLAALGDVGLAVVGGLAKALDLWEPVLPWHTERSRMGEIGAALLVTAGTLDKVALDIILLAQTEVGEVSEGGGGGGSSTLPQKRNPVAAVMTRACVRSAQAHADLLVRSRGEEHERAAGAWQAEWPALSSALAYSGGAASWLRQSIENLEVHPDRMRDNVDASQGLILAERASLLLSSYMGREAAHALLRRLAARVAGGQGTLRDALLADPDVGRCLSPAEIEAAMDPATYLGAAGTFIDRVLDEYEVRYKRERSV